MSLPSFKTVLEKAQLKEITALSDALDINGKVVKRWRSTDNGDDINIDLYADGFLDIYSMKEDGIVFFDDYIGEVDYE